MQDHDEIEEEFMGHVFYQFSVTTQYPRLIRWKLKQRDTIDASDEDLIKTVNASLIVDMACMCEGMLYAILREFLWGNITCGIASDPILKNVGAFVEKGFDNAAWAKYGEYFEMLTGRKLSSVIKPDTWKAIVTLFSFRNNLAHGKDVFIEYKEIEPGKWRNKPGDHFKNVFSYLEEKKLLKGLHEQPSEEVLVDILNNDVVAHFSNKSLMFIENLFDVMPAQDIDFLRDEFNRISAITM